MTIQSQPRTTSQASSWRAAIDSTRRGFLAPSEVLLLGAVIPFGVLVLRPREVWHTVSAAFTPTALAWVGKFWLVPLVLVVIVAAVVFIAVGWRHDMAAITAQTSRLEAWMTTGDPQPGGDQRMIWSAPMTPAHRVAFGVDKPFDQFAPTAPAEVDSERRTA